MEIKLLVSLSVLQYLRKKKKQLLQLLLGGTDRAKTSCFCKDVTCKRNEKQKSQMVCLILQEPQLKLNCESGLTLYPRRSFFPPFFFLFCFCFIYSLI